VTNAFRRPDAEGLAAGVETLLRRLPFTTLYVVCATLLALVVGAFWTDTLSQPWAQDVAYGLPAFEAGRWGPLLLGPLLGLTPVYTVVGIVSFALLAGFSEWRLGTARTVVIAIGFQLVTVLVTATLLWLLRGIGWAWATSVAAELDVGFSGGLLAITAVATATLPAPWKLRARLVLVGVVLLMVALVGQLADLEHLVAVALALPFAGRLAGPRAVAGVSRPSLREQRWIVAAGLVIVAIAQIVVHVIPERLTPFGQAEHTPWTWALSGGVLIAALVLARALRRGRRWAWWLALVAAAVPVIAGGLVLVWAIVDEPFIHEAAGAGGVAQLLGSAAAWLALLVVLVVTRRAFASSGPAPSLALSREDPEAAKRLLHEHGGGSVSWMTTWPRMRHLVTADGTGFIGFREHAGVAIALGDPVAAAGTEEDVLDELLARCEAAELIPFLFSCSSSTAAAAARMGWQTVQIAEDTLIDLPDLAFTGKSWQPIRTAINRAEAEGIAFRLVTLAEQPPAIRDQVVAISTAWLGEKALPEMGFTLGGVPEAMDPETRVALAVDMDEKVHGVLSWLPAYRRGGGVEGWTLDVMRRLDGGFGKTMEFLIASSALAFKEQGSSWISLGGAPLARSRDAAAADRPIEQLLDLLGATMEPLYGFRSLHQFKSKFNPRTEPMLMAFRDEADLPRIGIALTRAYVPDASVLDLAGVAVTASAGLVGSKDGADG
jgi:lysylphosphatidylglycerol synthetase-like protein (DUF2156 family)